MLKDVFYSDDEGRRWRTKIPADAPETDAPFGIPAGPPSLAALELPLELEVRLHNELCNRGLFDLRALRRHRDEASNAIKAALKINVDRLMTAYHVAETQED